MKAQEIFKPGRHPATNGKTYPFTPAMVQAIADCYSPELHEAPFVVGHPKSDAPAYGWAKKLIVVDGKLVAEPHQVNQEFAELVNSGALKKISIALYAPDDPNNPKPGSYYLRHVGFLGAQPPAVKGLKSAEFVDDDSAVIEFTDWTTRDIASAFRGLRDWMLAKFGQEDADKAVPSYLIDNITTDAVTDPAPSPTYSEEQNVLTKEQLEAQKREQEAKAEEQRKKDILFAEREAKIKAGETAARRTAIAAEVKALIAAGKILPKDEAGLVAFMETLPADAKIEFGEGDKKVNTPTIDWLRGFLKTLPKAVEFKERGAGDVQLDANANPLELAAELSRRALEFQDAESKAGRTINIVQAMEHVKKSVAA